MIHVLGITLMLCRKSLRYLLKFPQLLVFPLLNIIMLLLAESLFFYLFFLRYRISILDAHSLEKWALVSIWEFGFFVIVIIGPLYFLFNFISQMIKVTIVKGIDQGLNSKPLSMIQNTITTIRSSGIIFSYNYLSTLIFLTSEPLIKRTIKNQIREMGAYPLTPYKSAETWRERTFLVLPLIASGFTHLKEAINQSAALMRATFGALPTAQFNFPLITGILCLIIGLSTERIVTHTTHQGIGFVSLFLILGTILITIRIIEAIFEAVTLFYCTNKPTGIFTSDDFHTAFKVMVPENDVSVCIHQDF